MCLLSICGNQIVEAGEECDGGADCDDNCNTIVENEEPSKTNDRNGTEGGCSSSRQSKGSLWLILGVFVLLSRRKKRV